jgi:diguanylate cyclase (GGDEF)-like protein
MGLVFAAIGLALVSLAPDRPVESSLWAVLTIGILFCAAESSQVHVEFRRETYSVSASELPLILGLFLLPPHLLLLTRLVGAGVSLVLRRTAAPKVVCNLGLFTAEVGLAVLVLHSLRPGDGGEPYDWAVAYLSMLVVAVLGTTIIFLTLTLLDGRRPACGELTGLLTLVVLGGVLNVTMALITLIVLAASATGAALMVIALGVVMVSYRGYYRLLRQHADLGQLFTFTGTVDAATSNAAMVERMLERMRELFRAEDAVLELAEPDGATPDPSGDGTLTVPSLRGLDLSAEGFVAARHARDPVVRDWLHRTHLRDALTAPMCDDGDLVGLVRVGNRIGAISTFTSDDLRLLQTLAQHAGVLWHNGRLLEQLRHDAHYDALTGLANRSRFEEVSAELLATYASSDATRAAVLLLDLNRFKEVNDTLGHQMGDTLLRQVANRLRAELPSESLLARLGGDEFVLMRPHCTSAADAEAAAQEVRAILAAPFPILDTLLEVSTSVGVALVPDDGREAALLLQHADVALYAAKRAPSGIALYHEVDDPSSLSRLTLVTDLRRAIDADELTVYFQPQVALDSMQVVGYEALVRWTHPERGLLMPDEFIPLAEQTGLIIPLTHAVLRHALDRCRRWLPEHPGVGVSVNLSARGLIDPALHDLVARLLVETGVPAELLTLEITESSVMSDFGGALEQLGRLKALGTRLSVDDFGTGHSSLAYLQRLPVHEVKVDKSFVLPMARDDTAPAIVAAIVVLAHTLDLRVVAEGVETPGARDTLTDMGCDVMQGYLVSRPMSPQQLDDWLATSDSHAWA